MDLFTLLGYVGLAVSFLYLWLEFKQKPAMWIFSILCSCIYISIYFHKKLYADVGFSTFNVCISIWGLLQWLKPSQPEAKAGSGSANAKGNATAEVKKKEAIVYRRLYRKEWIQVIAVFCTVYATIYLLLLGLTDSPVPGKDALNTTMNIIGTWILGRKVIEVWGVWFLANLFSVYLYYVRSVDGDMLPTILLYLFYTGSSVYGFWKWKTQGTEIR